MFVSSKDKPTDSHEKLTRRHSHSDLPTLETRINFFEKFQQEAAEVSQEKNLGTRIISLNSSPRAQSKKKNKSPSKPKLEHPGSPITHRRIENNPLVSGFFREGQNFTEKMNELYQQLTLIKENKLVRKDSQQQLHRGENKSYIWKKKRSHKDSEMHRQTIRETIILLGVALDYGIFEFKINKSNIEEEMEFIPISQIMDKLFENAAARKFLKTDPSLEKMAFKLVLKSMLEGVNREVNGMLLLVDRTTNICEAFTIIMEAIAEDQQAAILSFRSETASEKEVNDLFNSLGVNVSHLDAKDQREYLERYNKNPLEISGYDGHAISEYSSYLKAMRKILKKYVKTYVKLRSFILDGISEEMKIDLEQCNYSNFIKRNFATNLKAVTKLKEGLPVVIKELVRRIGIYLKNRRIFSEEEQEKFDLFPMMLSISPLPWTKVARAIQQGALLVCDYRLTQTDPDKRELYYVFLNRKPFINPNRVRLKRIRISLTNIAPESPQLGKAIFST